MAKASIKCTCPECGATHYYTAICYNRREANNWEQYHADEATTRLCPECYRKTAAARRQQEREAENAAAAETAGKLGLPALTGTEKQVAWATTIRQQAFDNALLASAGRTSSGMTDKGRAFVAGILAKMPAEASWWIDNRAIAGAVVRREIECANWARLDDAKRADYLGKLRAEVEQGPQAFRETNLAELHQYERYERARLAGRTYAEQKAAEKAEEAAKKAADEAAKRATLPPVPAKLAERHGKWYGRDGLRVYLDGGELLVRAEVKAAWEREWAAYNEAKKNAGL